MTSRALPKSRPKPAETPPAKATQPAAGTPATPTRWSRVGPWMLVALPVAWGLWQFRAELQPVPYYDDSSLHQQMVRFAAARIGEGHLPLTSWFPYLGLGSAQFLHYQSLPSMIAGTIGTVADPNAVFRWSLYLLLALWPISVYWGARLFGLRRWTAAAAAVVAPFLASAAGIGYEPKAYVFIGFGVWTQLWASWTLPLAWGFTYRALTSLRGALWAVLFIMLTCALHFETGYLAFVPLVVWPFLVPSDLWRRLGRAAVLGGAALVASAWVIVPLIQQSQWMSRQVLQSQVWKNGYGAPQILSWLFSGQLYDAGRFPVVTILVGVGLALCIWRWRTFLAGRALVTIWVVTLFMTFGRTTWGALYDIVPGSSHIFMRRFQLGVHLSGILLAGIGVAFVGRWLFDQVVPRLKRDQVAWVGTPTGRGVVAGLGVVALVVVLAPAWVSTGSYLAQNSGTISLYHGALAKSWTDPAGDLVPLEHRLNVLIDYVKAHPRGRVYAGPADGWGKRFTVGRIPVYQYLESKDVDGLGIPIGTFSLMSGPSNFLDERNPGDYPLFGIGYLMRPAGSPPPVPAHKVRCVGSYCLWALPDAGYIHVYDTTGVLTANRTNVAAQSRTLLRSPLLSKQRDLTVAFNGSAAAPPTATDPSALRGSPGHAVAEHADLANGSAHAVVRMNRRATVVLNVSYDPGWHATVDGHSAPTVMVAPALVGVVVGPGVHTVAFSYGGYGSYYVLFVLALLDLAVLAVAPLAWRRLRPSTRGGEPEATGGNAGSARQPSRAKTPTGGPDPDPTPRPTRKPVGAKKGGGR